MARKRTTAPSARKRRNDKPVVLITGAAGNLGQSIGAGLAPDYRVIGIDRDDANGSIRIAAADLGSRESLESALRVLRKEVGARLASVIHLAAYFDFSGEPNPLYQAVNVDGTRHLLDALRAVFQAEQFVYASTMLVLAPARPGERIDETRPIGPRWEYPKSKAAAERVIEQEHGDIPYVLLRLAGVYDERSTVPTMAQQIAAVYERDLQSYVFAGDKRAGQAALHRQDMVAAFRLAVDRRAELPRACALLIGEPETLGYGQLQDELGYLVHGVDDWPTLRLPKPLAEAGVRVLHAIEPAVPDALDEGEPTFVKPFMIAMADDHYELDIGRARATLGWEPAHRLKDSLPAMVAELKRDPGAWYERHKLTPPEWIAEAKQMGKIAGDLAERSAALVKREVRANRWAHFVNIALGTWLITQPPLIAVDEPTLRAAEMLIGAGVIAAGFLSLSWRTQWARWAAAGLGALLMAAPFVFATDNAAAYLADTLIGGLIFGLAACVKPDVGPSPLARLTGPEIPPGWTYNPSAWTQRLPIVALALVGLYVSRYLAAYQLDQVPGVWEPFFAGSPDDPRNGTEEIITSSVSRAWPVSDAAVGAYTYMLEILTGVVGSTRRWRTMPWLVVLFGLMIAPLGVVSILFVIIQPIVIGTWSTLALLAALAVLVQIPYSLDELLASLQFVRRRARAGQSALRVFLFGDTDAAADDETAPLELDRSARTLLREAVTGGVRLPWNLVAVAAIALSLLFTRITLGADGGLAHAHHLIGALVLTVVSIAAAEVARPARFLNVALGLALVAVPFVYEADTTTLLVTIVAGAAIAGLSVLRGSRLVGRYGTWTRWAAV
jgi:nucleoside-diphosphate-sugar epimerase